MIGISNSSNASVAFPQVNDFTCLSGISGAIFSASVHATPKSVFREPAPLFPITSSGSDGLVVSNYSLVLRLKTKCDKMTTVPGRMILVMCCHNSVI